jgi:hypothetical protein
MNSRRSAIRLAGHRRPEPFGYAGLLRCGCSDTDIEITAPGLAKLLAMQDHDQRIDVLLRAVRLQLPGGRPLIHSNCFLNAAISGTGD